MKSLVFFKWRACEQTLEIVFYSHGYVDQDKGKIGRSRFEKNIDIHITSKTSKWCNNLPRLKYVRFWIHNMSPLCLSYGRLIVCILLSVFENVLLQAHTVLRWYCPGYSRSQDISGPGIDIVCPRYSDPATERLIKTFSNMSRFFDDTKLALPLTPFTNRA